MQQSTDMDRRHHLVSRYSMRLFLCALILHFLLQTDAFRHMIYPIPSYSSISPFNVPSCHSSLFMSQKPPTPAPNSFPECVKQAVISTNEALEAGEKLIEVEFPPLPLDYLEDSASSARDIASANTRWALAFSQAFACNGNIRILYPDQPEVDDAIKYLAGGSSPVEIKNGNSPSANVTINTLRQDSIKNAETLDQVIGSIFGARFGGKSSIEAIPDTTLYVAVVTSTQELPALETLHELDPDVPIVFFNLRLDILRGDLGLPLFPGRDLQYRFLSKIKPALLLKPSTFATSIKRPPFVVNYSGQLFRAYPEGYQTILNTGQQKSRIIATSSTKPTNLDFRNQLIGSLIIEGVPNEELKTQGNLVWWEKDMEQMASKNFIE